MEMLKNHSDILSNFHNICFLIGYVFIIDINMSTCWLF